MSGFFQPIQPPRRVQIMAHRSIMSGAPENTLPGFQRAIDARVEWIEIDVRLTADGQHIVVHDRTVDRTTNGSGFVHELDLDVLRRLDAGSYFAHEFAHVGLPTLAETLDFCRGRINLYLDCKQVDVALLVREILDAEMTNQVVVFDKLDHLLQMRDLADGRVPVMPSINKCLDAPYWMDVLQPEAVEVHAHLLQADLVRTFHDLGVIVQAQTLGDRDRVEMWETCFDMGVDWVQTDCAYELLAVIQKRWG
jgi:glycerophosphoryl diester phosphodiesterase